jgi:hypothetical protein
VTRIPISVRAHEGDEATIRVMVEAMATPPIEEQESLMRQQSVDFAESNVARRIPHLCDELIAATHAYAPSESSFVPRRTEKPPKLHPGRGGRLPLGRLSEAPGRHAYLNLQPL